VFRRIGWNERGEVIFHLQSVDLENKGIFAWNPKSDALRPIAKISAPALEIQHCLPSERTWICIRDDATHPPALVAIDVLSGKATTLFDPNPAFASKAFTRVERIEWTNDFGQSTFGQLVYPRGYRKGQRYPLVILSYRAVGFLDASTGREYPAHVLADQGFLVLVFNRSFARVWGQGTAGQYNEAFRDRREIQSSLEAGIRLIERRGLVDSDRVAIGGLSDGAAIVEWALLHSSRPYAAAMSSSGGFEPIWYYLGTAQVRRMIREDMGATFSAQGLEGSLVETLAMSRNASRLRTPLLYNLPDAEVLPAMQAIVTLNELGKPIEAHVYPREYHEKVQPAHRLAVYRRNVQWLQFWLQGKEAPDPVDAGQYTRWRVLRERQLANVPRASAAHVPLGRAEPAG
jgi:dipeptidyl aminopeptidase/acylaminoacyl peptidase